MELLADLGDLLAGSSLARGHALSIWLFLRLLGVVYLIAFVSLWVQVDGLLGRRGILPVRDFLERAAGPSGEPRPLRVPSLFWLDPSDRSLHLACAAGVVACLFLTAGLGTLVALLVLWGLYLSFAATGQVFLSYQWDVLLLEAGLLGVLVAPWGAVGPDGAPPPNLGLLLLWWLLFRLIFQSGLGKLTSGDAAWRDLSAMRHHWFTQPLPTPVAWHASRLSEGWHRMATAMTHVVEIGVPLLVLGPPEARWVAAAILAGFQLLIALTGNYNFFNLLTVGLCLLLVGDAAWAALLPSGLLEALAEAGAPGTAAVAREAGTAGTASPGGGRTALTATAAIPWLLIGGSHLWRTLRPRAGLPRWIAPLVDAAAPFRTVNSYGLFRIMTRRRPEILLEGSRDGETWERYRFRWKPDDPARGPPWVQPHQPRLDWQMWFAALGSYRSTPWFRRFQARLLEGASPVRDLLRETPFPDGEPPRYLRARLFEYTFTSPEERRRTGRWWKRREVGRYGPRVTGREN